MTDSAPTTTPQVPAPQEVPEQVLAAMLLPAPDGATSRAIHEVLDLSMPDGTVLRADVVRPTGSQDRPVPVLLARCPYFGAWRPMLAQVTGSAPDEPGLMASILGMQAAVCLDRAVEEGFAVVAQACRGTDFSEGSFRFYVHEADDGMATRQAVAGLPWCDGNVLTFGASYLTTTQLTAALSSTEHLSAMTPWVSPSSYDDDMAMRGGVLADGPAYEWARQQVRTGLWRDGQPDAAQDVLPETVEGFSRYLEQLGIAHAAQELARTHVAGSHVSDWVAHPLHDEYWEALTYREQDLADLDVPTLHVSGWYDLFEGGTLRSYEAMARGAAARGRLDQVRLVVGPWTHLAFDGNLEGRSFPGGAVTEAGMSELTLDFWKASLGDARAAARLPKDPVRVYVMGAQRWIDLPSWPAPDATTTSWRLSDAGRLLPPGTTGPVAGWTSWCHDPSAPVPAEGGQMLMGLPEAAGPHDQRLIEERSDVAVFTGPVLTEPVTVLGPVRLRAWVSADAADAHLHAALTDVAPDGTSTLLTDGVLRLSARNGLDCRDPLVPGEPVQVEVDMWSTAVHLPQGHCVRLDLSGSCWPRYGVADPADGRCVEITVRHDEAHPTELLLPLVDLETHPGVGPYPS